MHLITLPPATHHKVFPVIISLLSNAMYQTLLQSSALHLTSFPTSCFGVVTFELWQSCSEFLAADIL